jgi:CSLREA domain-containing protein
MASALTLALLFAGPASAATINVNTTADALVSDINCSLREAVQSANANAPTTSGCAQGDSGTQDIINLPAGTYTLSGASGDDANAGGDLDYTGGGFLAIQGPANPTGVPSVTIDAPAADRILDVPGPPGAARNLQLNNLSLTDGRALGGFSAGDGGAIRVGVPNLDLQIASSRVTGNQATRNGGAVSFGSADSFGNLQVDGSEFSGNSAAVNGGAFFSAVDQNQPMINSSTLAGNQAAGVGGALALADGPPAAVITFRNSTLSGNSASGGGGAVGYIGPSGADQSFFEFSTIAGNTAAGVPSNCAGPSGAFTSYVYNVESANTCNLVPANPDLVNTDPLLAPLAISTAVGATQTTRTHGLYDGSPAVDFIPRSGPDGCDDAFTDQVDQRGVLRPAAPNGLCDAGAFEGTVGPKPPPPPSGNPTPTPTTPKKCKKGRKLKKGKCVKKKRKKRKK